MTDSARAEIAMIRRLRMFSHLEPERIEQLFYRCGGTVNGKSPCSGDAVLLVSNSHGLRPYCMRCAMVDLAVLDAAYMRIRLSTWTKADGEMWNSCKFLTKDGWESYPWAYEFFATVNYFTDQMIAMVPAEVFA